jgi:hypothetical protein
MEEDIITREPASVYPEPKPKSNRTIVIVLIILILLCCCCTFLAVTGWWGWNNGDQLMEEYLSIINSGIRLA